MRPAIVLLLAVPACVVVVPDDHPPQVLDAEARCGWDPVSDEWIWEFDANVTDRLGPWNVVSVQADAYDGWSGEFVDAIDLDRSRNPYWWDATVFERETRLWCGDAYEIDFVAEDAGGAVDVLTTWPARSAGEEAL